MVKAYTPDLGLADLDGEGAVLQLPDIQRQRISRGLLTGRPVSAPGGRVLKHLSLAPTTAKLCTCRAIFNSTAAELLSCAV